ncbi:hypothetical protein BN1708_005631, partial [Verticillium longisporum]
ASHTTARRQVAMSQDERSAREVKDHLLFEIATEVAHRVGGIYSVIKSKAPVTTAEYGERYTLIGPLNHQSAAVEVEELEPTVPELAATINSMKERGIGILYGRWLIEGAPRVLLFDTKTAYKFLDEWKTDLWNVASIPSPPNDDETNEAIVFGYLVAWFLGEFVCHEKKKAVIAHFHEWLAGVALPLCKKRRIDVTTIFTTHATLLGRYLCAGSVDFYNNLQWFDVDAEAGKRGIYHRYCIERAAAHACDVFTTVSHITAYESEHLLKRKPDGVLPNGLNVTKFSAVHEFQNLHQQAKEKIHEFVRGHFYGHYDFDPENTLYFFTAGRYEFRNKGVDIITTNLSGFGCYMEELIENSSDYGIYIVDRRMKGVDDSVNALTSHMFDFCQKSRRQRINQRNRTERLSDLLDWKRMGMEYVKARQLALRRAYPGSFQGDEEEDTILGVEQKISRPFSVPGSPRDRSGMMTPGDFASLQEGREGLSTEDYVAWKLPEEEDPEEYPFPLTLRTKRVGPPSPLDGVPLQPTNGNGTSSSS